MGYSLSKMLARSSLIYLGRLPTRSLGRLPSRSLGRLPPPRSFGRLSKSLDRPPMRICGSSLVPLGKLSNQSTRKSIIVPKRGVYGWTSDSGKHVKYIGSSYSSIYNRLNSHIQSGKLTKNNQVFVYPMPRSNKTTVNSVEKTLISLFQPTFNRSNMEWK